jgi:cell shape-determining protein MreC
VVDNVVRIPQEPFADVTARPSTALDQVREVMLIWQSDAVVEPEPEPDPEGEPEADDE